MKLHNVFILPALLPLIFLFFGYGVDGNVFKYRQAKIKSSVEKKTDHDTEINQSPSVGLVLNAVEDDEPKESSEKEVSLPAVVQNNSQSIAPDAPQDILQAASQNTSQEVPESIAFQAAPQNIPQDIPENVTPQTEPQNGAQPENVSQDLQNPPSAPQVEQPQENTAEGDNSVQFQPVILNNSNPFNGAKLFVNYNSDAKRWADANRASRPQDAAVMDKLASQPETQWLGGWNADIYNDVNSTVNAASAVGAMPVFIVYNIPQRDCGGYSAGGVGSPEAYKSWIRNLAKGIGSRKAAVILEPDALANIDCLSQTDRQNRLDLLRDAISVFNSLGNAAVYLDAGHPGWKSASDTAVLLNQAGIDHARGFSLNVSNFFSTNDNIDYGRQISKATGNKHFVIDTGRNGLGPTSDFQWCNPPERALGSPPTTSTGNELIDAFLWMKKPTESDGPCNGGPSAGTFFLDYALGLASRANW